MKTIYILLSCLFLFACNKEESIPWEVNAVMTRPYAPHLTIQNNLLYLDGDTFKINEANSPESRLRECSLPELDQLNACGINTIYATLYGGDATTVHPFINRNNPSQGFNDVVVDRWVAYLEHWIYGYPGKKHIVHLLLSEKENHTTLTEIQSKTMMAYFAIKFRNFEGYIIYNREELPQGRSAYINTYYSYLRQVAPYSIRGMHNNTGENPWQGFGYHQDSLIQFLALQEWNGNFDRRIRAQVQLGNWAVYASEVTGGFQTHPSCSTLTHTLATAGGSFSSGLGYYISSKCNTAPTFHGSYCGCYQYGASLLGQGGTIIMPNPTTYTLKISTSSNRSGSVTLGTSLTIGNKYIFVDGVTTSTQSGWQISLYKNNAMQSGYPRPENSLPIDLKGGTATTATAQYFSAGSWRILAKRNGVVVPGLDVTVTVQ